MITPQGKNDFVVRFPLVFFVVLFFCYDGDVLFLFFHYKSSCCCIYCFVFVVVCDFDWLWVVCVFFDGYYLHLELWECPYMVTDSNTNYLKISSLCVLIKVRVMMNVFTC